MSFIFAQFVYSRRLHTCARLLGLQAVTVVHQVETAAGI